jgi:hypothetical protein
VFGELLELSRDAGRTFSTVIPGGNALIGDGGMGEVYKACGRA